VLRQLGDCLYDRATVLVVTWTELHISPSGKENVSQFAILGDEALSHANLEDLDTASYAGARNSGAIL
jgi:hypothetical protein